MCIEYEYDHEYEQEQALGRRATTARLDRALAGTRIAAGLVPEQGELLAKRDALLALTGAAA